MSVEKRQIINEGVDLNQIYALPSLQVVRTTGNYTATLLDYTIMCDTSSGNITITLPTSPNGRTQSINIKNIGTGVVTVTPSAGNTIDGQSSLILNAQYASVLIQSNFLTGWLIIGGAGSGGGTSSFSAAIKHITSVNSPYIPTANDFTLIGDTSFGAIIVNLPLASSLPRQILNIKNIDDSASITINAFAGNLIDGQASLIIDDINVNYQLQSDGLLEWFLL